MIDLLPDDQQQQIIDSARSLLTGRMSIDRLRTRHHGDPAADAWSEFVDFGWFMLGLPEDAGGAGVGLVEEMLLFREAGRYVLPPSVLATSLAALIAAEAGDPALAGALASGEARAGFAARDRDASGGWLLVDAEHASHVVELDAAELRLFPLDAFTDRRPVPGIDEAASLERAALGDTSPLATAGVDLAQRALVLVSSLMVGLAEGSLALAVDYAKIREQFGQPIGGFQAVKHRCADMAVRSECAGAQVGMASLALTSDQEDAGFQVWSAALSAVNASRENGAACIQVHGGMGFTWECHAHRFMKRAQLFTQLLGGPRAVESHLLEQTPSSR